jgi:sortase A
VLFADLRQNLAAATTPVGGAITPGTPIAVIRAPRAGIRRAVVVEGTTSGQLTTGPGHLADTPLPGQAGVSVLMGRSAMFGAPFARISSLRSGDSVAVTTGQGSFTYVVQDVRYPGALAPTAPAAGAGRLELVTSYARGWRAHWAPRNIVIVDATLTGAVAPTPSGRPSAVPTAALPMHGQQGALVPLLLWLQALVLAAVGLIWAHARWGGRKTWLAGFPLGLALLWGATGAALLLLPNLI